MNKYVCSFVMFKVFGVSFSLPQLQPSVWSWSYRQRRRQRIWGLRSTYRPCAAL